MPDFKDHWKQANDNLAFLSKINKQIPDCWDWQVTACFYTAVHFVNAHLSCFGLQYRSHADVNFALNPANVLALSKLPEEEYTSYMILQGLSRRSRYLVSEQSGKGTGLPALLTFDKHLAKAVRHTDKLATYFCNKYAESICKAPIDCAQINKTEKLTCFELV